MSMKEKRMNHRAMHDSRKPRNLKILTTSNDMVEPRLNRKDEHPSNCAHMTPLDTTESNGLSTSNGNCLSP